MAINTYLKEVRQELAKVTWPSREQTIKMTVLVVVVSIALGLYVGGLDFVFAQILTQILQ